MPLFVLHPVGRQVVTVILDGGRGWESNPPTHLHGQAGFEDQ